MRFVSHSIIIVTGQEFCPKPRAHNIPGERFRVTAVREWTPIVKHDTTIAIPIASIIVIAVVTLWIRTVKKWRRKKSFVDTCCEICKNHCLTQKWGHTKHSLITGTGNQAIVGFLNTLSIEKQWKVYLSMGDIADQQNNDANDYWLMESSYFSFFQPPTELRDRTLLFLGPSYCCCMFFAPPTELGAQTSDRQLLFLGSSHCLNTTSVRLYLRFVSPPIFGRRDKKLLELPGIFIMGSSYSVIVSQPICVLSSECLFLGSGTKNY